MKAKALIFDFDGVIANTEPLHYRAFQEVLEPEGMGYSWQEYMDQYLGFDDRDALRHRYKRAKKTLSETQLTDLKNRKATAFERLVARGAVKAYPGVVDMVKAQAGSRPVGLCSGAVRSDILPVLKVLEIESCFQVMVTADDVVASKPDPTCYRMVVEQLGGGLAPGDCVAIEDTPAGIESAQAAGLRVIAVTNTYGRDKLFGADRVVTTLAGLRI